MARRAGLGRGLESLLGETAGEVGDQSSDQNPSSIPLEKIAPNPNQPRKRFNEDELKELAGSIEKDGVLQPILLRPYGDGYQIVAGERRFQAARLAGLKEIPAVVKTISDEDVFKLALVENLQRSDLDPIETALGYRELLDRHDITQEELGKALSISRSAIANTLRLLDLPSELQDMLAEGEITAGHARALLAIPTAEDRVRIARKVQAEGLSVRQTERLVSSFSDKAQEKTQKATPLSPASRKVYKAAAKQLQNSLGTSVKVRQIRGKSKIEIEFNDEEQLKELLSRMTGISEAL